MQPENKCNQAIISISSSAQLFLIDREGLQGWSGGMVGGGALLCEVHAMHFEMSLPDGSYLAAAAAGSPPLPQSRM